MLDTPWLSELLSSPWLIAYVVITFAAAGLVKGTIGVGLPLLAVPLLALVLPPMTAIALLAVPVAGRQHIGVGAACVCPTGRRGDHPYRGIGAVRRGPDAGAQQPWHCAPP